MRRRRRCADIPHDAPDRFLLGGGSRVDGGVAVARACTDPVGAALVPEDSLDARGAIHKQRESLSALVSRRTSLDEDDIRSGNQEACRAWRQAPGQQDARQNPLGKGCDPEADEDDGEHAKEKAAGARERDKQKRWKVVLDSQRSEDGGEDGGGNEDADGTDPPKDPNPREDTQ